MEEVVSKHSENCYAEEMFTSQQGKVNSHIMCSAGSLAGKGGREER